MTDINTPADVALFVDDFYNQALKNNQLKPAFEHMNWDDHLPRMKQFWRFVLLDEAGYKTQVIEKHLHLNLTKEQFSAWIETFEKSIDNHFSGPNAETAKQRARLIAFGIQSKMGLT